jgi:hypothetical protein
MINPQPVKSYTPPQLPTLADVRANPEHSAVLKRLPRRWKKSAAVLACIGIAAASAPTAAYDNSNSDNRAAPPVRRAVTSVRCDRYFGGCGGINRYHDTWRYERGDGCSMRITSRRATPKRGNCDCRSPVFFLRENVVNCWDECCHHGGSGAAVYVVHLTEAEALGIIRRQLEDAGLEFGETPDLPYVAPVGVRNVTNIRLFDEERNVAVALTHLPVTEDFFNADQISRDLTRQSQESGSNITFGAFVNPMLCDESYWGEEAREEAEATLLELVQMFVERLQEAGILPRTGMDEIELPTE